MTRIACPLCDKTFKNQSGLSWHNKHIHDESGMSQAASQGMILCSPAVIELVSQVVEKTNMSVPDALDFLVAAGLDDIWLEATLDTWDLALTGIQNAPYWLPLDVVDHMGNKIDL